MWRLKAQKAGARNAGILMAHVSTNKNERTLNDCLDIGGSSIPLDALLGGEDVEVRLGTVMGAIGVGWVTERHF